ncbi:aspartyl protease family protein [Sphingomonas morindae]|uniref:Aspartyl protease family protein n=1 Tax=Sphingomonas morindae TaxID=1541170 RepID=A0ABY4XCU7_9SPHN|nr:aspartyl protease family protein [Sphingomonas morindae]USI74737.1 aspartyl protease family protein [Sphingomonas morindae]
MGMVTCSGAVRSLIGRVAMVFLALIGGPAWAKCEIKQMVELPVTISGNRAIVTASINDTEARFILDSGAFFSTIAPAAAARYGMVVRDLGTEMRMTGIGGSSRLRSAVAKRFVFAGIPLRNIEFAVGGSDFGTAGLLGQNILGIADIEYDLPHGVVRLMKTQGCGTGNLAYWAGQRPVTMLKLEPADKTEHSPTGTVRLNDVPIRAIFDSGAESSLLTRAAARRAGVVPGGQGVTEVGESTGIGQGSARTWRAQFERLDLNGEIIPRPVIDFADAPGLDVDMLIGFDFFLTHRIFVDNDVGRLWFTYEGGPLFGLHPKGAVDAKGGTLALPGAGSGDEPKDAAGYARRGAVRVAADRKDGLADLDKAIALAPDIAHYRVLRADALRALNRDAEAARDLDEAIRLAPHDGEVRLSRARLRLKDDKEAEARADLEAADADLPATADQRLLLGSLLTGAGDYPRAIVNFTRWLDSHKEDSGRVLALNGRCWARALANSGLAEAESDCAAALRRRPNDAAILDSRALLRFRLGRFAEARADYDRLLPATPDNALGFYVRGLAEQRLGDAAAAEADRKHALALSAKITTRVASLGLAPATSGAAAAAPASVR